MVDVDRPEPVKTDWQLLGRLIPFVQPQRLWLGLTVLHALEGVAVRVLTPFLLQQMMDSATDTGVQSLTKWFYVAGLVLVIDAGFAWAGRHAVARYGAFTARDLRDRVTAHIQRLPMGFLEAQHSGDLVSRLNSDVTKIESWLPGAIKALSQPLVFVGGVVYMLSISWKLLLASSILIPISALLYNQVSKPMEALARQQAQGEGRANAALQDMLAGSVTVKAFNLQTVLGKRFNRLIREIQRQALRLDWRRSVFVAVFLALRYIPQLIVPLYGGYLAFQGEITVGELLAANLVIWLVFLPIETLLDSIGRTRETLPSVSRVLSLLDEAAEPTGGKHFERLPDAPAIR
ncbi:MAG: ABC transporter transmembrane domain-containing protein, partial [Anaerolineae bacterium]